MVRRPDRAGPCGNLERDRIGGDLPARRLRWYVWAAYGMRNTYLETERSVPLKQPDALKGRNSLTSLPNSSAIMVILVSSG